MKRVLIVDDDMAVRESISRVLEDADYEVALAADGQTAIERFVPEQIDLVLLDLSLPVRSGWDVFELLTTRYPFVPIIVITGLPNQYKIAVAAGAGALMEKPIEVPALLKTITELLAEPAEVRLGRVSGYLGDTRYVGPSGPQGVAKSRLYAPGSARPVGARRLARQREE